MKNGFKMRNSCMFRSLFGSCKSRRSISDIIDKSSAYPPLQRSPYYQLQELSPNTRPLTSTRKPQKPMNSQTHRNYMDGGKCPPASPYSPLINHNFNQENSSFKHVARNCKMTSKKKKKIMSDSSETLRKKREGTQESQAVVKRSSDPYCDFKDSMLEMIKEEQIYGVKDLEKLLERFLSLNSYHHHGVIIEVFTDIWEFSLSNK